MEAPPALVAGMGEALYRRRLSATFGNFRKVDLDEIRQAVSATEPVAAVDPGGPGTGAAGSPDGPLSAGCTGADVDDDSDVAGGAGEPVARSDPA